MGGLGGAASSSAAQGVASSGTSAASASGASAATAGIGLGGAASGIGLALTAYNLIQSARENRMQLKKVRRQQMLNHQTQTNILEEQLAARRAKLGSMGISQTGSAAAANNKLISDTYSKIASDSEEYNDKFTSINEGYKDKLRKQYLDAGLGLAGKVIK